MTNIDIFLNKSENLRKGYLESLDKADSNFKEKWLDHFDFIPSFFDEIFSVCNGTKPEISEQVFFDFLPGFRLMQVDEIIATYEDEFKNWQNKDYVIPFLTDYASCYYAYAKNNSKESIVLLSDEGMELIHSDITDFWNTIIAFYEEGVYFLDEDGYLSYDFEMEGKVGKRYNSGVSYWE